jgi:hypothetical protein
MIYMNVLKPKCLTSTWQYSTSEKFWANAQYTTQFYEVNGWKLDLEQDFCPDGYPLRHSCRLVW